ncbi:MAG: tetratricopeptide repeat protein [Candidatus Brocadiia bacterium]
MLSRRTLGCRPPVFRAPHSAFCLLIAAAFGSFCAAASAADAKPAAPAPDSGPPDLNVQLEIETGRLEQMKQQLQQMEKYLKEGMQRRQDLSRDGTDTASREQALANVPAAVVSENLRVERVEAENGLIYTVSARNVSLLQILEAVSKTSGLPLETRQVPQDRLLNRLWMNLNGVEMSELLRIAAGTQSLDAMADGDGIVVAPLSALTDRPVEKRLRELAVEAYQQALFKYPASAEAPAAYLGIARHYAASNFPTAAIQTAQNILDRYQKTSGGPAARGSADGDASVVESALLLIGNCYEALREYDTARKTYYRYADLFPGAEQAPAVMVMIAETWIKEHKYQEAMPVLEETIRQWPKSDSAPFARMRLAECLSEQQHYDQAVAQLEIIEQNYASFPRRDELNLAMADCLIKLKQFGPARVRLKYVYEKSPDAALAERALYALGDSQLEEENTVAALEVYRGAVSRFPEGALVRLAPVRMAQAYLQMGLCSRAEDVLKLLPASSPAPAEMQPVLISLARYYLQNGQYERVLALMAEPRWPYKYDADPQVLLLAAQAAFGSGLVEPALEKATAVAAMAEDDETRAQACRLVGECRSQMKEPVRAAMAFGGKTE